MEIFRQGDVMLVRVSANPEQGVPAGAKDVTAKDRIVLAFGEVTGHAHAVYPEVDTKGKTKMPAKLWDAGAERFLQVLEKTALKHEEHTAVPLDPGTYRVVQQREYAPEAPRQVMD